MIYRSVLLTVSIVLTTSMAHGQLPQTFEAVATKYNIDPKILYALSMSESGKKHADNKFTPWAWTANICEGKPGKNCKGYWFNSREELYSALQKQLAMGNEWFDVGIMQMNWRFHKDRFGENLWLATHPLVNMNQSVGLLLEIQTKHKDLNSIFKAYHAGIGWNQVEYTASRKKQIDDYAARTMRTYTKLLKAESEKKVFLAEDSSRTRIKLKEKL